MNASKVMRKLYRIVIRQVDEIPPLRLLCLMGIHSRSRRHVYRDNTTTYSECRRCQTRMARLTGGDWHVVEPGKLPGPVDDHAKH